MHLTGNTTVRFTALLMGMLVASSAGPAAAEPPDAVGATDASDLSVPAGWQDAGSGDEVVVFRRDEPDRPRPRLRGVSLMPFDLLEILAVIDDPSGHPTWIYRCREARLVERLDPYRLLVYIRTRGLWPVQDRDVLVDVTYHVEAEGQQLRVEMHGADPALTPEIEGVVRMSHLEGEILLRRVGPDLTRVEYELDSDPRGRAAARLARLVGALVPIETLARLRLRVEETRGSYADFVSRWQARSPAPLPSLRPSPRRAPETETAPHLEGAGP